MRQSQRQRDSRRAYYQVVVLGMLVLAMKHVDSSWGQTGAEPLNAFINQWCLDCHSAPSPKADLDLAAALNALDEDQVWPVWRDVQARAIAKDMPPKGQRPTDAEYQAVIEHLQPLIDGLPSQVDGRNRTTIRRLNRVEYTNTVADLFSVDFDPENLPVDEIGHGFDNNGDMLSISPLLFEKYMDAAEMIARAAIVDLEIAEPVVFEIRDDELSTSHGANQSKDGWVLFTRSVLSGEIELVHAGRYRIEAKVAGKQAGDDVVKMALLLNGSSIARFDVPGHMVWQTIGTEVELEPGLQTTAVRFLNDFYRPEHPDPKQRDRNAYLESISLTGPLDIPRPTPLQRWLFEQTDELPEADQLAEQVRLLAAMSWRRDVSLSEVEPLLELVSDIHVGEPSEARRLRTALTAILVHPRFLFRIEVDPAPGQLQRTVDAWEWATRVSYFLWSSAPDSILMEAASSGALDHPGQRYEQIERMLKDPRTIALAERFGAQWLQIDGLSQMRPDQEQFGEFTEDLLAAMRAETVLVFDAILREDRPLRDLLNADWTFMNEVLARHYNIAGIKGSEMRRVSLDRVPHETLHDMGVFRHASVLLATSNPTRTSPVKRGKWVLEVLFDDPTPPPPANVDGLPNDGKVKGEMSLRAMLEIHRSDPACISCHERLDPLGFALEPFDAVGRWREHEKGVPIDSAARLPDGTLLEGPKGLRDLLLERSDFLRSCCRHMLTYALGRGLSQEDEAEVDAILRKIGPDPTLRSMVIAVIESQAFAIRRADQPAPAENRLSINRREVIHE